MGCCVYTEINAANKFLARRVAALCKRVTRICRLSWGPEKYTFGCQTRAENSEGGTNLKKICIKRRKCADIQGWVKLQFPD